MTTKPNSFENNSTLFFAGVPTDTEEKEINQFIIDKTQQNPKAVHIIHNSAFETTIAYISFHDHESAKKVMEQLNGEDITIKGKVSRIGVSWCINDQKLKRIEVNNLLIKGLKENITTKEVLDCCKKYGEVISIRVSFTKKEEEDKSIKFISNKYCFIKFYHEESVEKLIKAKEEVKKELGDEIIIEKYETRTNKTNVYVSNVGNKITMEEFKKVFEKFGKIKEKAIILCKKDKNNENSEQYGYVDYEDLNASQLAIKELNDSQQLGSERLHVEIYLTKKQRLMLRQRNKKEMKEMIQGEYKHNNLFIKRISQQPFASEKEVKEIFGKYGEIYSCRVKYEKKSDEHRFEPAATAYVCFKTKEAADKVLEEYKNSKDFEVHILKSRNEMRMNNYPPQMYNLYGTFNAPVGMFPFFQYGMPVNQMMRQQQQGQKKYRENTVKKRNPQTNPKPKKEDVKQQPPKPKKEEPKQQEKDMDALVQELGDDIYDYIESSGKYDEDMTGKITGILLSSYNYDDLKGKFDKKELDPVIDDIVKNLNEEN